MRVLHVVKKFVYYGGFDVHCYQFGWLLELAPITTKVVSVKFETKIQNDGI